VSDGGKDWSLRRGCRGGLDRLLCCRLLSSLFGLLRLPCREFLEPLALPFLFIDDRLGWWLRRLRLLAPIIDSLSAILHGRRAVSTWWRARASVAVARSLSTRSIVRVVLTAVVAVIPVASAVIVATAIVSTTVISRVSPGAVVAAVIVVSRAPV
jgi:hypothetical protein